MLIGVALIRMNLISAGVVGHVPKNLNIDLADVPGSVSQSDHIASLLSDFLKSRVILLIPILYIREQMILQGLKAAQIL